MPPRTSVPGTTITPRHPRVTSNRRLIPPGVFATRFARFLDGSLAEERAFRIGVRDAGTLDLSATREEQVLTLRPGTRRVDSREYKKQY
jgi:hypothetical protein